METMVAPRPGSAIQTEARERILKFEEELAQVPGVVVGGEEFLSLKHSFAHGLYVRDGVIPAGTLLTGKIHRHSHAVFLLEGEITIYTEHGGAERLKAPQVMISPAGTKRIIYAHTDARFVNCHATTETDLDKIEEFVIVESYEKFEQEIAATGRQIKEAPCSRH